MAAHLLAYPIVKSSSPTESWIKIWSSSYTLREITEFGEIGMQQDGNYSKSRVSELLLLAFRIGLAILDQRAGPHSKCTSLEARSQAKLHEALASAVREMYEIDNTLNGDKWRVAGQHLAIRRLIWEHKSLSDDMAGNFSIFQEEDYPTFGDYLNNAKGDVFELLAILSSATLNRPDTSQLQNELFSAGIDLPGALAMARQLNQYSASRYPINEDQLGEIEKLIS